MYQKSNTRQPDVPLVSIFKIVPLAYSFDNTFIGTQNINTEISLLQYSFGKAYPRRIISMTLVSLHPRRISNYICRIFLK